MFYLVMIGYYHLEACSFLIRDRNGVDLEGREGGRNWEECREGNCNQDILYEKDLFSVKISVFKISKFRVKYKCIY